jgi:hypothetical protein
VPDKAVLAGDARDDDAVTVDHRDHLICRRLLAPDDVGKCLQARVHRQHIDDGSVPVFDRHVDRDDRARYDRPLKQVRDGRLAGLKNLPRRLEVCADRQRRAGRQDRVHDLLSVFLQQQDVGAGKLLRHEGFGSLAEASEVTGLQHS